MCSCVCVCAPLVRVHVRVRGSSGLKVGLLRRLVSLVWAMDSRLRPARGKPSCNYWIAHSVSFSRQLGLIKAGSSVTHGEVSGHTGLIPTILSLYTAIQII